MITSSANKVIVPGNGAQTSFGFGYVGAAADDLYAVYTDANGNETQLVQGPGPTQFQVTLNAAAAGTLWGVGGNVTYNPSGTPIANGTTLTIYRDVAFTQGVSLQNQSSYGQYAQAAETAMDLLEMQIQQIAEAQNRVLSAPIVDPSTINLTLPAAAQRANTGLAFDSLGNVIAGTTPATGLISSAMQPVVDAASIADALVLLGIGTIATLTPNYGLQENVSSAGDLDVNFATVQDAANQTATAAFHLTQRFATGALSYSLAESSTLWNGFGFWVTALTAPVSFAPNAADNFAGMSSGVPFTVPAGSSGFVTTSGAGTWWLRGLHRVGLNSPLNLRINASVSSNTLTVAIKDGADNDPSVASPVLLVFRDPTVADGDPQVVAVTAALSVAAPPGATLGTIAGAPFRLWLVAFDNAGAAVLGLFQTVSWASTLPVAIAALDESAVQSPAAIGAGSAAAATFYAASALAGVAFRVLGYVEFGAGQPTAGQWSNPPSKIQLAGPSVRKPLDTVQAVWGTSSSGTGNSTGAAIPSTVTCNITPTSAANLMRGRAAGALYESSTGTAFAQIYRGSSIGLGNNAVHGGAGAGTAALLAYDAPGTTAQTTYAVYLWQAGTGEAYFPYDGAGGTPGTIEIDEVMT